MTSKTHVALGLLTGIVMTQYYPSMDVYILVSGACIGSLLPDLDTKKSDPSQIFPLISSVVDKFTKHRGATHTMFPLLLIILYYKYKYIPFLVLGAGSISHALIDAITLKLGITCDSTGENIIYTILWAVNITLLIVFFFQSQNITYDLLVEIYEKIKSVKRG